MKSPVFGEVAANPSSLPVRRVKAWMSGSPRQNSLDDVYLAVGLGERAAGGSAVVEDESSLVHFGEEAGAHHPWSPSIDSRSPAAAPSATPRCASIHPIALP